MIKHSKLILFVIMIIFSSNISITSGNNFEKIVKLSSPNEVIPIEAWNKTFGGENLDWGWSVKETSDGGMIIAGETVSFGSGGYDAWLIKTDSNGNESWNRTFGGIHKDGCRSVQQTTDNGFILGGYADSYGYPGHDAWFIKTDDEGNKEWDSIFGGPASDATFSILQTSDEGYVGLGYVDSYGAGNHDLWLIKTDKYGNEEWNKTYGTAEWELGYSVKECDDGGFIIIGTTQSYGAGYQDAWLIKTDSNGVEEWNNTYGGVSNDWGSGLVIVDDGYLITGDTRSYGPGGYDIWLIKTDKNGNELWKRVWGESVSDDTGYDIVKADDGGFVITGTKTSFSTQLTDIWLIKTDDDGYMEWNLTIDGGEDDWSYSVDETTDGGYIITGLTNSYGSGDYDLWLIKVELVNYQNQPPTAPIINGSKYGDIGEICDYTFVAEDTEGDDLFYFVDWGDGTLDDWFGPFPSGEEVNASHSWDVEGQYEVRARAKDFLENEGDWSDPFLVRIGNNPPNEPNIDGPKSGKAGNSYDYIFNATDPDEDDIWYHIGWGDKEIIYIYGPYPSGEEISLSYIWLEKGTYIITCWARDIYDEESEISTLEVKMPRNKPFYFNFNILSLLFERFTNRLSIIKNLLPSE
jgi:predicted secreted protein